MIWLLSAAAWLRKGFDALLALALRYPLQVALIASLAANAWMWRGWEREQVGRAEDRAVYAQAQAAAKAKQAAADRANLAAQFERNQQVEQIHAQADKDRLAALSDYIERNRLRPQTACRPPGRTGSPGLPADPASPADSNPAADLVAVTPADLDRLARGAVRGAECTGYLHSLIDGGLAKVWDGKEGARPEG